MRWAWLVGGGGELPEERKHANNRVSDACTGFTWHGCSGHWPLSMHACGLLPIDCPTQPCCRQRRVAIGLPTGDWAWRAAAACLAAAGAYGGGAQVGRQGGGVNHRLIDASTSGC